MEVESPVEPKPLLSVITLSTGRQIGCTYTEQDCVRLWKFAGNQGSLLIISIDNKNHYFNPSHIVSIEPYKTPDHWES